MNYSKALHYLCHAALLLAMTGCATTPNTSSKGAINTPTSTSPTTIKAAPSKPKAFSVAEIKDISAAFQAGSCDLTKLTAQGQKYGLDNTWVNLYERTPKPLSSLDQTNRCFLAQSNELFAYRDDFYDESSDSLNKSWFKNAVSIPDDAHIVSMRYVTPKILVPNCDPDLGRPVIIDYEKDEQGRISRTILINEDFDPSCVK